MRHKGAKLVGMTLLLLLSSPALGQILIDDFDYSDPFYPNGVKLELFDTDLVKTSLEMGLPDSFFWSAGAMGQGTGLIADDYSGTRYVQADWQGHLSPAVGDLARVKVNRFGSGVADVRLKGDPRVVFGYGSGAGSPYAFGPFDFSGNDVFKLELLAPEAKDLTFGLFLWAEIHGITQLWSSNPFMLAAGDTEAGYDIPEAKQFTAWNGSEFHPHHTVGDLLANLTGISLVIRGDQNPNVRFDIDYMFMDVFGSLAGDLNANGVVDGGDVLAVSAAVALGDPVGDVNGDGVVDAADLEYVVEMKLLMDEETGAVGTVLGDFNLDGLVNASDVAIMAAYYGGQGDYGLGDANGDGVINAVDLALLAENFGSQAGAAAVPEPVTLSLLGVGAAALLRRKRD